MLASVSLRDSLFQLPLSERVEAVNALSNAEALSLLYDWDFLARPEQREPLNGEWLIWLIMTGRGWGKTLTGAQTTRKYKERKLVAGHIALVGSTAADVRDVMLGLDPDSSGLLQVCPPWDLPVHEPSKRRAVWPDGTVATLYSAEEPDRLRGPQHGFGWGDEPAAWERAEDTLSNMLLGLRRGSAKAIFTTTPRSTSFVRQLTHLPGVHITRGAMKDNPFLAEAARTRLEQMYAGTRLGRQELGGELLDDNPDALWTEGIIERARLTPADFASQIAAGTLKLQRVVVAIDPAVTSTKSSNETGIIVAAIDDKKPLPHAYILDDLSITDRPERWAEVAVKAYKTHLADRIVGEVNNGGDLVESVIRNVDRNVSYSPVRASRGKIRRAEPISALYEKGRVHHVGHFYNLELQMTEYDGSQESPDRMDALVWALTELIAQPRRLRNLVSW